MRCDGMDILDTHRVVSEALARVREERRPLLIEAVTYRFRGHSMADPEDYRSKEEVAEWRERDPIPAFGDLLEREGMLTTEQREQIDRDAMARVDEAVEFAERSPFPDPDTLYEDVYVLDERVHGDYHGATRWCDDRDALSRRFETGAARGDAVAMRTWCCSARTSACSAVPSRSHPACSRSSASGACATPRSPRTRSWEWAWAPRWSGCAPSWS